MSLATHSPDEHDINESLRDDVTIAINVAARRMTAAAPSTELRARVMSRIDVLDRRASAVRWGWRLAMAGGAIGAVALSTAVMWHEPPASVPPVVDVAASATPPAAPAAAPAVLTAPNVTVIVPMPQRAPHTVVVSAAELEWRARAVPALAEPDALHVAPLQHTELTVAPLDIAPLTVPPLAVVTTGAGGSK
jgi:hypothetical protein